MTYGVSGGTVIYSKPRKHPPYLKMISDAIVSLKERNGSSQYAIGKFIQDKQKNLPANFKKQLLNQLKKLVAGDKLVKVKGSYKLPSAAKPKPKPAAKPKIAPAKPAAKTKPASKTVMKKALAKKKPAKAKAGSVKAAAKPNLTPKSFQEAADIFDVSRSNLKHSSRSLGIKGWPHTSNKTESHSSNFRGSNEYNPATHTEHAMYSSTRVETILIDELGQPKKILKNSVKPLTIKATYKDDTVRFPFILSDGLTKLKEQIATRFRFKLARKL